MMKLTIVQLEKQGKKIINRKSLSKVYGKGGIRRPIFEVPNPTQPVWEEEKTQ